MSHKLPVGHDSDDAAFASEAIYCFNNLTVIASEAKQSPELAAYGEVKEIATSLRSSR